jgi:hypothetical protein
MARRRPRGSAIRLDVPPAVEALAQERGGLEGAFPGQLPSRTRVCCASVATSKGLAMRSRNPAAWAAASSIRCAENRAMGVAPAAWSSAALPTSAPDGSLLNPSVPVVVMTAAGQTAAEASGADAYLTKPFDLDVLLDLVVHYAGPPASSS